MNSRDVAIALAAFTAGYAICWWRRPLCQAPSSGPTTWQSRAESILTVGDYIDKSRPYLEPIAAGQIPSPATLYNLVDGVFD